VPAAGRLKDAGIDEVPLVSLAKRAHVAMALDCARKARDILGAAGITDEFSPGRHMANLESVYTYEGTHDIPYPDRGCRDHRFAGVPLELVAEAERHRLLELARLADGVQYVGLVGQRVVVTHRRLTELSYLS
jgi:hypothetical protein